MAMQKQTRAERQHIEEMMETLERAQTDMMILRRTENLVPPGWSDLDRTAPCTPDKEKMTIRLDADMLGWFRQLGNGWQNRINAVLRAYMHAIIAKHIDDISTREWLNMPKKE